MCVFYPYLHKEWNLKGQALLQFSLLLCPQVPGGAVTNKEQTINCWDNLDPKKRERGQEWQILPVTPATQQAESGRLDGCSHHCSAARETLWEPRQAWDAWWCLVSERLESQRGDSEVKSVYRSYRGPTFGSQHPDHGELEIYGPGLLRHLLTYAHPHTEIQT